MSEAGSDRAADREAKKKGIAWFAHVLERMARWLRKRSTGKPAPSSSSAEPAFELDSAAQRQDPATVEPLTRSTVFDLNLGNALQPITLRSLDREPAVPEIRAGSDKFHLVDSLGEGGMGKVFLAYDQDLRRRLALKTVRPQLSHSMMLRFFSEAQVMGQLAHPNIVTVL